jgi:hypothetical protein
MARVTPKDSADPTVVAEASAPPQPEVAVVVAEVVAAVDAVAVDPAVAVVVAAAVVVALAAASPANATI